MPVSTIQKYKSAPSQVSESSRKVTQPPLEREFRSELNAARSATAQERVADADVPCRRDWVPIHTNFAIPNGLKAVDSRIGDERGQEWIREVRVIQDIEEFRAQLHVKPFGNRGAFVNCQIPLLERRSVQSVAA